MRTKPKSGHVLSFLPDPTESVLDVGCNVGAVLDHARKLGVKKLYGIDINPGAVALARQRLGQFDGRIEQGSADDLPFPNECVEVVICSEVLEHVPSSIRPQVVQQIFRVLKPNGLLILSVPAKGLFSFLDPANFRFLFPRVFRVLSNLLGGSGRERGMEGQKHGLVWHKHFSLNEIEMAFGNCFSIQETRTRGCVLTPICAWLQFPFYRRGVTRSRLLTFIQEIETWEMSLSVPAWLAYNVVVVARKSGKSSCS